MKTSEKLVLYSQLVQLIDYDHKEGGKYAYVQFLSYTREILLILRPHGEFEHTCGVLDEINSQFNGYLCDSFGEEQRVAFHRRRTQIQLLLWEAKLKLERAEKQDLPVLRCAG